MTTTSPKMRSTITSTGRRSQLGSRTRGATIHRRIHFWPNILIMIVCRRFIPSTIPTNYRRSRPPCKSMRVKKKHCLRNYKINTGVWISRNPGWWPFINNIILIKCRPSTPRWTSMPDENSSCIWNLTRNMRINKQPLATKPPRTTTTTPTWRIFRIWYSTRAATTRKILLFPSILIMIACLPFIKSTIPTSWTGSIPRWRRMKDAKKHCLKNYKTNTAVWIPPNPGWRHSINTTIPLNWIPLMPPSTSMPDGNSICIRNSTKNIPNKQSLMMTTQRMFWLWRKRRMWRIRPRRSRHHGRLLLLLLRPKKLPALFPMIHHGMRVYCGSRGMHHHPPRSGVLRRRIVVVLRKIGPPN